MVLKDAAREVYRRLMDPVDPALIDRAEQAMSQVEGVDPGDHTRSPANWTLRRTGDS
nr:hypothetical protein HEP87_01885 [Streptomyces sp. S1D4-11]